MSEVDRTYKTRRKRARTIAGGVPLGFAFLTALLPVFPAASTSAVPYIEVQTSARVLARGLATLTS